MTMVSTISFAMLSALMHMSSMSMPLVFSSAVAWVAWERIVSTKLATVPVISNR